MVAEQEPQDQGELKKLLQQFMDRYTRVENEMELLKEDAKNLLEEFEDRLDTKTLKQAIRIVRAKKKIKHQDTFERYESVLDDLETL
jgi:uncharacterized protein (UPF0335 family)